MLLEHLRVKHKDLAIATGIAISDEFHEIVWMDICLLSPGQRSDCVFWTNPGQVFSNRTVEAEFAKALMKL